MTLTRRVHPTSRAAFTLMEVLVVAAILVILAGAGTFAFLHYLEQAKQDAATAGVFKIETAVQTYKLSRESGGAYPETLQILLQPIGGKPAALEEKDLVDPWGNLYVYEPTTLHPTTLKPLIYSLGPNPGDPSSRISNFDVNLR